MPQLKREEESWKAAFERMSERRAAFVPRCTALLAALAQLPGARDQAPTPVCEEKLAALGALC